MPTLADRVELEDERRFVGRTSELALFDDLIEGRLPYRVVDQKSILKRIVRDAHFSCVTSDIPVVLLLTGEVLW